LEPERDWKHQESEKEHPAKTRTVKSASKPHSNDCDTDQAANEIWPVQLKAIVGRFVHGGYP